MIGKKNEKNNVTTALNVLYAKKEKIYPVYASKHMLMFQNITQIMKNKLFF